jgi:hypothetical protein
VTDGELPETISNYEGLLRDRDQARADLAQAVEDRERLRGELAAAVQAAWWADAAHHAAADERDRLRAVLAETEENVETWAEIMCLDFNREPEPDGTIPTWQDVIDEDSADEWRASARRILAALRARAGLEPTP